MMAERKPDLRSGDSIGKHEILRVVGEGGFSREPAHRFQSTPWAYEELLASVGLRNSDVAAIHRRMFNQFQGSSVSDSVDVSASEN